MIVGLVFAAGTLAHASDLHSAAAKGDLSRVRDLLKGGADPNSIDAEGVTPLHLAAAEGHVDVAKELLRVGANVNQAEFDGDTPLVNASAFGHIEVVQLLIDHGADVDVQSSRELTPIQLARRGRHSKVVKLLKSAKAAQMARAPAQTNLPGPRKRALPMQRPTKKYRPGYGRRIAAVIGVNDYEHWPRLSGAKPDAEKVAKRLRGLGFDEVFELYDRAATRGGILDLLGEKLPAAVGEDDLVVVFFAGHGETETIDKATGSKRGYIIPVEATVDGVFSTAIAMQTLRELTNRLPAKHVYYAMDSCYSGLGFTRGLSLVKPTAKDYISKVTSLRAVQMVTAGGEGEEALEKNGEGIFTRSFLDALDGAADANKDGYVTATEIGAYVAPRVTNETGARQSPQAGRLEGEGEIAFQLRPGS